MEAGPRDSPVHLKASRGYALLAAASIAAFFFRFTAPSLRGYFSSDDNYNLYFAWHPPLTELLKANLLFFLNSRFYRPLVAAWYRSIYHFAGFNPLPFHVSILIVLAANVWLTYAVARRLSGSREIGALSALLVSYHPNFAPLYFDTGFAYDVICYFFYFSAFLLYLRIRRRSGTARTWESAAFLLLYVCALNSKEMAITLPAFLGIYELLYERMPFRQARELGRWLAHQGRLLVASTLLMAVFVAGRFLDRQNSLLSNQAYVPLFSWDRFMETSRNFLSYLLLRHQAMGAAAVLAIWLGLLAIAWLTRSRPLWFAWLFLMLSAIPVAFITPRAAAQYYIPLFGWALFAATVLVRGSEYLWRHLPRPSSPVLSPAFRAPALFILAALLLLHYYRRPARDILYRVSLDQDLQKSVVEQLHALQPALRHGSRILFLDDPIDDRYQLLYLIQLSYRDRALQVDRVKWMPQPPGAKEIASYDYLFDYRLGRFFSSAQPRPPGPEPVVTFEWGRPAVFHGDFKLVSRRNPADRGEIVICQAKDLGETMPAVAPGKPFPLSPLLDIASPVGVRVGGESAEVLREIGWPDTINHYRLDVRIPKDVRPGEVAIEITASHVTGPAVTIPVR
jgi:hypothetical protein